MQSIKPLKQIEALYQRQASALHRKRVAVEAIQGVSIIIDGKAYLSFASNDYLGLTQHPQVILAYQTAVNRYGAGSVSSPLLCGYTKAHQDLEEALADFSGFPKTLLFSSGYMANLAAITSFIRKEDIVFSDRHNHASILDAIQLSSATLCRYPHLDLVGLQKKLEKNSLQSTANNWIIAEGIYSVDGDINPLPALIEQAKSHNSRLILDEAHAFGILGPQGRGTIAHYGLRAEDVYLVTGSFSKAFGCFGGFIAAAEDIIEALVQFARPYMYSTALPAAVVESLRVSLKLMTQEDWRRERLAARIMQFRKAALQLGINIMPSKTPMQIILIGDSTRTLHIHHFLKSKGIWVGALRPPTVAFGQDRLRITFSALHTESQVEHLLQVLDEAKRQGYLSQQ